MLSDMVVPTRVSSRAWPGIALTVAWIGAALAYGIFVCWHDFAEFPVSNGLYVFVGVGFVVTGLVLRGEPAQRGTAALFVLAGFAWLSNNLGVWMIGPLPTIGWLSKPIDELILMVVLLRYPYARITDQLTRRTIVAAWAGVLTFHVLSGVTWDPATDGYPRDMWWPTVVSLGPTQEALWYAYQVLGLIATVAAGLLVIRRVRRATGLHRRELLPVAIGAATLAVDVFLRLASNLWTGRQDVEGLSWIATEILLALVPTTFAVTALRRRLDRITAADAVIRIAQPATVASTREALRVALADPALDVLVWLPEQRAYVDVDGVVSDVDRPGRLRRDVPDGRGDPLAVVLADPQLERRPDVMEVAVRAAGLSLENARLHAELLARLAELDQSRARVVEAGVAERRRVERDLHDGAQQRLLALATTLGRVHAAAMDPPLRQLADQARTELRRALRDLRDLARGIHPAVLDQIGLAGAVEAVAESLPVPVELHVLSGPLPRTVETTAYFVVCEALANAVKHADATRVVVTVRRDDDTLQISVTDDGVGGAVAAPGGGLGGIQDRVAALRGHSQVDSPAGGGTRLIVEMPCV